MGQATVDLPDPLDAAAESAAPPASADDLLAQLAGEEIDRLLAEADAERPTLAERAAAGASAGSTKAAPVPPKPAAGTTTTGADRALVACPPAQTHAAAIAPIANPGPGNDPAIARELDALFQQLNPTPPANPPTSVALPLALAGTSTGAAAAPLSPAPRHEMSAEEIAAAILLPTSTTTANPAGVTAPAKDDPAAAVVAMNKPTGVETTAADPTPEEIEALADSIQSLPQTTTPSAASMVTTTTIADMGTSTAEANALRDGAIALSGHELLLAGEDEEAAPLPVYVRALEILNAPFAAMPETFRDLLGKVALLTLFNSLAVLTYVLLFRRHH